MRLLIPLFFNKLISIGFVVACASGDIDSEFSVTFPDFGSIKIRRLNIDQDAEDIHDWVNQDYAKFWGMQGSTLEQVRDRYGPGLGDEKAYIGVLESTGKKVVMFLTFWAKDDPLGPYISARDGDMGVHTFVAPSTDRIKNITFYIMKSMQFHMFSDPKVKRIVGDPDISNEKVLIRAEQAGYRHTKALYLPNKTARFGHLTRDEFLRLDHDRPAKKVIFTAISRAKVWGHVRIGRMLQRFGLCHWTIPRADGVAMSDSAGPMALDMPDKCDA